MSDENITQPPAEQPPVVQDDPAAAAERRMLEMQGEWQEKNWQANQRIKQLEAEAEELRNKQLTDPYEAFRSLGGSVDELAERLAGDGEPSLKSRYDELQQQVQSMQQALQDKEEAARQDQIASKRNEYAANVAGDMMRLISDNEDEYSDVRAVLDFVSEVQGLDPQANLSNQVLGPIEENYKRTGKVLTPVELLGNIKNEMSTIVEKFRSSKALKAIMGVSDNEPTQGKEALESIFGRPSPAPRTPPQPSTPVPDSSRDVGRMSNSQWLRYIEEASKKS